MTDAHLLARQNLESTKIHGDDNESDNGAGKRESKNITHVMSGNTTSRFNGALDYRRWWCVIIIHGHRPSIEAFAECYTVDAFPTLPRQTSSQRGSVGLPYRQLPGPLSPPTLSMFVIGGTSRYYVKRHTRGFAAAYLSLANNTAGLLSVDRYF